MWEVIPNACAKFGAFTINPQFVHQSAGLLIISATYLSKTSDTQSMVDQRTTSEEKVIQMVGTYGQNVIFCITQNSHSLDTINKKKHKKAKEICRRKMQKQQRTNNLFFSAAGKWSQEKNQYQSLASFLEFTYPSLL